MKYLLLALAFLLPSVAFANGQIFSAIVPVAAVSSANFMSLIANTSSNTNGSTTQGLVMPIAGTFSNMYCYSINAVSPSWNFFLRVNDVDQSLECQLVAANSGSDTTHTVHVNVGDVVWMHVVKVGSSVPVYPRTSVLFTPDTANETMWVANVNAFTATTSNVYNTWFGQNTSGTSAGNFYGVVPDSGTLSNYYGFATTSPTGGTWTFEVGAGANGSFDANIACVLNGTATCQDTTDSTTTVADVTKSLWGIVPSGSTLSKLEPDFSMRFVPTIANRFEMEVRATGGNGIFVPLYANVTAAATTEASSSLAFQPMTVNGFTVDETAGIGAGNSSTFTLDDNGISTGLACTITGTGAAGTICTASGSVTVSQGDLLDYSITQVTPVSKSFQIMTSASISAVTPSIIQSIISRLAAFWW